MGLPYGTVSTKRGEYFIVTIKKFPAFIIKIIAAIELFIGLGAFFGIIILPAFLPKGPQKPLNVLIFVLVSAAISAVLGYGLLSLKEWARRVLVFFAWYIVMTKVLLFAGLLQFTGEIITTIPPWFKNITSIAYHSIIIFLLENRDVKHVFHKEALSEVSK